MLEVQEVQEDVVEMEDLEEAPTGKDLWRKLFQEFLVKTTQSMQRFRRHRSPVRVRLTEVIMQTLRVIASLSTSAQAMEMEDSPSSPSSAPMEPFSTSSTLSVTGGSMWTAPLQKTFIS